jgi:SAM-dependent methyltransferase
MSTFSFGSNWEAYSIEKLNEMRVAAAMQSLQSLLQRDSLKGLTFLDVGCGSGLFSIAAWKMGAERVVGIDIDPRCIKVSERNRDRLTPDAAIAFVLMSVLNSQDVQMLGKFDVVYAWGALHHTGAMLDAIRIAARRVAAPGTLILAIYNRHWTSPIWKAVKQFYNRVPRTGQRVLIPFFAAIAFAAKLCVTRHSPLAKKRGMDFWYDVIDWIGGYPYEYATRQEIVRFVEEQGFALRNFFPAEVPTGCNEYVFVRSAARPA